MKKQIYCPHYKEEAKKTSVYTYKLINCELNMCQKCEKKLRKQIHEQEKAEAYSVKYHEKWKMQKPKNRIQQDTTGKGLRPRKSMKGIKGTKK